MTLPNLDWGAIGVIGGAVYTTYQALTNNSIKSAILELKLAIQDRFAKVEQDIALNFERHLTLSGTVKELQDQIVKLQNDLAYRDAILDRLKEKVGDKHGQS